MEIKEIIMTFNCYSLEDTYSVAKRLAKKLNSNSFLAFFGDLGAGKTAFIGALAKALGYKEQTFSPTFAIVNCYQTEKMPIYHFDMYRVENWEDLYSTGYFDYLEQDGIMAVEWSENIYSALPDERIEIEILRGESDNHRIININGAGEI